nr:hypothetical protein [Nonlabens ulvanivorans]
MSKRGSRNAKYFAGKSWSVGSSKRRSKSKSKWEKRREKKKRATVLKGERKQKRLHQIYKVFDITNDKERELVKEIFFAIPKIGKQQRAAFNAGFYKFYCNKLSLPCSVFTFLNPVQQQPISKRRVGYI